jgi:alkylation response protein AidB-like acyl-CoA dehydrogenase
MHRNIFEQDHDIFRDSVARFLKAEVTPNLERWLEAGIIERDLFRKAGEQGYCLMWAEEDYGGMGVKDFRFEQILIEENALNGDAGFGLSLHSRLCAPYIGALGSEEQKARLLPACVRGETILGIAMTEPGAGSDVAGIRSHAELRDGDWLLNGSKTYISNGINGDVFIVAARTVADQPHGIGLFLVERGMDGFTRGRNLKKLGLKAQDTAELFFDNVRVPAANVLGDPHKGFYYLMQFLAEERLIVACGCVAAAEAALRLTLDYVRERRAFGRAIAEFQNTRFKLAEMRTRIDACQALIDRCVMDHNEGRLTAEVAAEAKLFASEVEAVVTDECLQLHGGAGYMDEYPISRLYANARVSRIYAGSSEIMKEIIARSMGLDPRRGPA